MNWRHKEVTQWKHSMVKKVIGDYQQTMSYIPVGSLFIPAP